MYLERVEIVGFRGINRLSLLLNNSTVLIGENAWGKSSLLDALTLLLAPGRELYRFSENDFYYPPGEQEAKEHYLQIIFTFCEHAINEQRHPRYRRLSPVWNCSEDGIGRIYYRVEGELNREDGTVCTWRSFLNENGSSMTLHHIDKLAMEICRINPVLRLRDARFIPRFHAGDIAIDTSVHAINVQMNRLSRALIKHPHSLSNHELQNGLAAMQQLFEHYFAEQRSKPLRKSSRNRSHEESESWRALELLSQAIDKSGDRRMKLLLLGIFSTLLQAKGSVVLDPECHPLLLLEDPETRLHPIMLSVTWGLLNQLPLQRITTTNSGELLSLVPVEQLCRLVRQSGKIATYRLVNQGLGAEDSRRIAFHIRFNRAASLFSRCWLLVEGETEVWLLSELARQCGFHFETEGIKIIEFAQCGLRPLVKFASRMGIEWHVLVDGDDAGRKYANTVRALIEGREDIERDRLTVLPAPDMEHFMYREGFGYVYHHSAAIPENVKMPIRRIIQKAIHRRSKPDLAIEVAMAAARSEADVVPVLLRRMFSRVLWLAKGRAD